MVTEEQQRAVLLVNAAIADLNSALVAADRVYVYVEIKAGRSLVGLNDEYSISVCETRESIPLNGISVQKNGAVPVQELYGILNDEVVEQRDLPVLG